MIKDIAWNTFKNTGNINTFMELKQIKEIDEVMKVSGYENYKGKWNSNS